MKRPRIIWPILLATAVFVFLQPTPQTALTARIKVENDGDIIAGKNITASSQFGYDPYFIHENYTPEISIQAANQTVRAK